MRDFVNAEATIHVSLDSVGQIRPRPSIDTMEAESALLPDSGHDSTLWYYVLKVPTTVPVSVVEEPLVAILPLLASL